MIGKIVQSNYVELSDLGNWVIKVSIPFFNIITYIHYDYFESYINMYKDYYNQKWIGNKS